MAADPAIIYWNRRTLAAIEAVRALRARGVAAYFTIDAGPHVKVLCATADAGDRRGGAGARPRRVANGSVTGRAAGARIRRERPA